MQDPVANFPEHYRRVFGDGHYDPDFIGRFYEIFMGRSADIAQRFENTNMSVQKTMLHDSLHYLLQFAHSSTARDYIARIARIHGKDQHNIPPALYDLWEESLLMAVAERDPAFNNAVELAWRVALAPGLAYMKFCYEHGDVAHPER